MEGLASYGSDDDYEESPQRNPEPDEGHGTASKEKPARDNYEDVRMELSENENGDDTTESKSSRSSPSHTPPTSERRAPRRDKKDKERRRRSSSGSRSRSRSPPRRPSSRRRDDKRDRYRKERDSRNRSGYSKHRSRSRERDRSREASRRHYRDAPRDRYSKRFERASNKLAHLEKMGIDVNRSQEKRPEAPTTTTSMTTAAAATTTTANSTSGEDRLLPPGVTGRLREQMERRKALWQKKPDDVPDCEPPATATGGNKVWQGTTFAHDQEGKQANKFKRLMGIREAPAPSDKATASLAKQQEELFTSMEQQYEVARTATHTMRGVGLGFGSYQR